MAALLNPASEEELPKQQSHDTREVERRLQLSAGEYARWRRTDFNARADGILRLAELLIKHRDSLARLVTTEMGKVLPESLSEVDKCATSCRTLVEQFPSWRAHHEQNVNSTYSITREPMGVLLGIMPWNFPLWQAIRFAVPAVLCGNTILLKHAPNTWGSARRLEELFAEAFSNSVYLDLRVDVPALEAVIGDARVRGVSLTGSRQAGSSVGALAGKYLKKCVLELGGSDAYLVFDDADVKNAAEICARSRLINAGQSCVSAKRFIVTKKNHEEFVRHFSRAMSLSKIGDPMTAGATGLAPMARRDLRDQLSEQMKKSVAKGARVEMQAEDVPSKGFYFPPTVLTGVEPGMPAFDEELFGPVAAVIRADDEQHAVELSNRSRYGLGGAIFSRDVARVRDIARTEIEAGMIFINDFVKSDAVAPFGGVKDSGLGRELGLDGCFEFTNTKSVYST